MREDFLEVLPFDLISQLWLITDAYLNVRGDPGCQSCLSVKGGSSNNVVPCQCFLTNVSS